MAWRVGVRSSMGKLRRVNEELRVVWFDYGGFPGEVSILRVGIFIDYFSLSTRMF